MDNMIKIMGRKIMSQYGVDTLDMDGKHIDVHTEYVAAHINGQGKPLFVTVQSWTDSRGEGL